MCVGRRYCAALASGAVHASFGGATAFAVGPVNGRFALLPLTRVAGKSAILSVKARDPTRSLLSFFPRVRAGRVGAMPLFLFIIYARHAELGDMPRFSCSTLIDPGDAVSSRAMCRDANARAIHRANARADVVNKRSAPFRVPRARSPFRVLRSRDLSRLAPRARPPLRVLRARAISLVWRCEDSVWSRVLFSTGQPTFASACTADGGADAATADAAARDALASALRDEAAAAASAWDAARRSRSEGASPARGDVAPRGGDVIGGGGGDTEATGDDGACDVSDPRVAELAELAAEVGSSGDASRQDRVMTRHA